MDLLQCPLFAGVTKEAASRLLSCFQAEQQDFAPGEVILRYDGTASRIGILTSGSAALSRVRADGSVAISQLLEESDLFGEIFSFSPSLDITEVRAEEACSVVFIDKHHITHPCCSTCAGHLQVIQNLFVLLSRKVVQLDEKVELLSKRTTREKLLCFFAKQAAKENSAVFHMPFAFTTLAEYLSVDRSAMMRELKKMREEGFIRVEGRTVTLLALPEGGDT